MRRIGSLLFFLFPVLLWAGEGNLLKNPGFESAHGSLPAQWFSNSYKNSQDVTRYVYSRGDGDAFEGAGYVTIRNLQANDSRYYQYVKVKPGRVYRLSARIKADSCGSLGPGGNLTVLDSPAVSRDVKESRGQWVAVEIYGLTGSSQHTVPVGLRLGTYGAPNTGSVSFDDIRFEEVRSVAPDTEVVGFSFEAVNREMVEKALDSARKEFFRGSNLSIFWFFLVLLLSGGAGSVVYRLFLRKRIAPELLLSFSGKYYLLYLILFLIAFYIVLNLVPYKLSPIDRQLSFVICFAALAVLGFLLYKEKRLSADTLIILIIACGVMLRLCYLLDTDYNVRQHDVRGDWGHLAYIQYIAGHLALPPVGDWQTYHPPLHYLLSALVYKLSSLMGASEYFAIRSVQVLMVFFNTLTLIYFVKILNLLKAEGKVRIIAVALAAFHPAAVYFSAFLNNDNTLFLFYTLSLFHLLKWYKESTIKNIIPLGLCCLLAVLTKKSGLIIGAPVAGVVIARLIQEPRGFKKYLSQVLLLGALVLPLFLVVQLRSWVLFQQGLGYTAPSFGLQLPSDLYSLFRFSLEGLLKNPYNNIMEAGFFSEYLFKSALFGEWSFPGLENLGRVMLLLSAGMGALLLISLFRLRKGSLKWFDYIFTGNIAAALLVFLKLRLDSPYAFSQVFRYIAPMVLLPLCFYTGRAVKRFSASAYPVVNVLVLAVPVLFCAASTVFILGIR